jgi:hypothetical protein
MVLMKKTINFPDEIKYVGEVKNGKPHGKGTLTYPDKGGKYVGQWKNGKYHGKGKLNYGGKQGEYIGEFKNGKCDGYGEFKQRGVQKYSGNWKNGKYHGQGTLKHYKEEYTGIFKNGELPSIYLEPKENNINQTKNKKKIKYTFSYIKKELDIFELINHLDWKDKETQIIIYIIWSCSFKGETLKEFDGNADNVLKEFGSSVKKTDFAEKLLKYQFDGTLLPKLNNNFKLEIYFEMCHISHALISSKIGKKFYHIFALREWDKKRDKALNFKKPSEYILQYNNVVDVLDKKPTRSKFFELIMKDSEGVEDAFMEKHKSIDYDERESLLYDSIYVSEKGINYYDLYKKGKL